MLLKNILEYLLPKNPRSPSINTQLNTQEEIPIELLKELNSLILYNHLDQSNYVSTLLSDKMAQLHAKIYEPMQIAVVGQFSSGKSTFLNALLSKNILPTGITPVTSKINYIKYAETVKLEVTFVDGREQFYDLNSIVSFTDQRGGQRDDISFLTLYYPLELLKSITFIDTPGLNSNSQNDTNTTEKVLETVDGIIWLTLVESAAKNSEKKIISKYIQKYASKSLCLINQKDKIDEDELEEVIEHVEHEFQKYFTKIEAISAKQALDALGNSEEILLNEKLDNYLFTIKNTIGSSLKKDLNLLEKDTIQLSKDFIKDIQILQNKDQSSNKNLLKKSNIKTVLEFIEKEIKPQSKIAKHHSIILELKNISHIMIEQNNIYITILSDLIDVIQEYDKESTQKFDLFFTKEMTRKNKELLEIFNKIILHAHHGIKKAWTEYEGVKLIHTVDKGFFSKTDKVVYENYNTAWIDSSKVRDFISDDKFNFLIDLYLKNLSDLEDISNNNLTNIYNKLQNKLELWTEKSLDSLKQENSAFSEKLMLNFKLTHISNKFEFILNDFENHILKSLGLIGKDIIHYGTAVRHNYYNAIMQVVGDINSSISVSEYNYEKQNKELILPTHEEILNLLKYAFHEENFIEGFSNETGFLKENIESINIQHTKQAKSLISKVKMEVENYNKKNSKLEQFIIKLLKVNNVK